MNLSPGIRILDVGCVPGELWDQNRDRGPLDHAFSLPIFPMGVVREAHATLCGIGNLQFAVMDVQAISLSSSSVDVVIANQILPHVPNVEKVLEEIWRVLRPRGRLYAGTRGRTTCASFSIF